MKGQNMWSISLTQIYRRRCTLLHSPHVYTCTHLTHMHAAVHKVKKLWGWGRSDSQRSLVTSTAEISTSCPSIVPQQSKAAALKVSTCIQSTGVETVTLSQYAIWGGLAKSIGLIDSDLFLDRTCCSHSPQNNEKCWNLYLHLLPLLFLSKTRTRG